MLGSRVVGPPFDEVDARLRSSIASCGYLTLAVDPRRLDQAAAALATTYGLEIVNLTDALIDAAKSLAEATNVDWNFLLEVDAKDAGGADRARLEQFISEALKTQLPQIFERPAALLLTDASPLGRYRQQKWLADLADLTFSRPAARWLLIPHRTSAGVPSLDGHVAVPLGADGYLTIAPAFLDARTHAAQLDQEHTS
jgi:hypothetical protein